MFLNPHIDLSVHVLYVRFVIHSTFPSNAERFMSLQLLRCMLLLALQHSLRHALFLNEYAMQLFFSRY